MKPSLSFDQPVHLCGRIHAYSAAACVGVIYPLGDGRATWRLHINGDRGEAKSIDAAKDAVATEMGRWMDEAGVVQKAPEGAAEDLI